MTIPESITWIGTGAFYNCRKLTKIYFNAKNCSDCNSNTATFYNAGVDTGLVKVVFGNRVKRIPANLFYVNSYDTYARITEVVISDSVQIIEDSAFDCCFDLTNVTWGKSIKTIGRWAFEFCMIKSVMIPETTTSIGYKAFYGCSNLSSVYFNAINCADCHSDGGTFYNAGADRGALKVEFGPKVKVIPANLFYVDENYNYGDGAYAHITSVKLSDSILEIKDSAFDCCFDLVSVTWGKVNQTNR